MEVRPQPVPLCTRLPLIDFAEIDLNNTELKSTQVSSSRLEILKFHPWDLEYFFAISRLNFANVQYLFTHKGRTTEITAWKTRLSNTKVVLVFQ